MFNLLDLFKKVLGKTKRKNCDEAMHLKGSLIIEHRKANGDVSVYRRDNLILNVGFDFICNSLAGTSRPAVMGFTAIGTGTTAVAAGQTSLTTEIKRKAATYAHTTGTKVFTLSTTFAAGEGTGAITEAGICNASTAGIFLDRVVFDVINKASDDVVTTNFQFTLS